ncbi:DUF2336 domain-containing protein [Bradyrhizobium diazoefficiens]|jgi:hypothetical protein|nr:DUF2336 domain-containing protein [Bradyrhizobium diazoefficiens]MBR0962968.1 DUF2336 domain-containing protein [Bradyrhizobium diazoefficiens]MBR0977128.1 DUF2336 domain-containing protein [Bradyrhizobium diazoefficiens]MBR1005773.1 DUF2336 domain-containing protein [Bradyrhizobium diazoefficiens]MBR1012246.1 DUF2336 domain-containing protein [Bradyrhizobium diazoefficiens]MBR1049587.1 DUF2336 domain-containing protein [Bradyrhizobium diazoefficiens]
MMANSPVDILGELEDAVAAFPQERCARILAGIVQLLANGDDQPQDLLVRMVDGLLLRLSGRVASSTLVQMSHALAELAVVPRETLLRLASHEDPDVACPVLQNSQALSPSDLATIAASGGERQQRAICARDKIEPTVAEALIGRGDRALCLALIENPGTSFSFGAYASLIMLAERDDEITKALALRPDTPDLVVQKLLAASPRKTPPANPKPSVAPPASGAAPARQEPRRPCPADYDSSRPEIVALSRIGKLNDSTVNRFAIRGETANLFVALSVLSGAPIEIVEHVMTDDDCEGLVMACRASRLNWTTTLAILNNRSGTRLSFADRERAQQIFESLLLSTSQWSVRWGEIAASAGASDQEHRSARMGAKR